MYTLYFKDKKTQQFKIGNVYKNLDDLSKDIPKYMHTYNNQEPLIQKQPSKDTIQKAYQEWQRRDGDIPRYEYTHLNLRYVYMVYVATPQGLKNDDYLFDSVHFSSKDLANYLNSLTQDYTQGHEFIQYQIRQPHLHGQDIKILDHFYLFADSLDFYHKIAGEIFDHVKNNQLTYKYTLDPANEPAFTIKLYGWYSQLCQLISNDTLQLESEHKTDGLLNAIYSDVIDGIQESQDQLIHYLSKLDQNAFTQNQYFI